MCTLHEFETIQRCVEVKHDGWIYSQKIEVNVVTGAGTKSSLHSSDSNKGIASDRSVQRIGNHLQKEKKKLSDPAVVAVPPKRNESNKKRTERLKNLAEGTLAETQMVLQQTSETHSDEEGDSKQINPMTAKVFEMTSTKDKTGKRKFSLLRIGKPKKRKMGNEGSAPKETKHEYEKKYMCPPKVKPTTMTDKQVKRRTGFKDCQHLLAYIIIVCNGDFCRIRKRCGVLTWFEEWVLYFEWCMHPLPLITALRPATIRS